MDLLGQFDQPAQPCEACFARRFRRVEEPADLEVDADDIRPQPFHRTEISLDLGPLRLPVVFQQSALGIVIVVQSPRHERPPRGLVDEARPIFRDADRFHLGGRGDTTEDEKHQGKKMERFGEHGKRTKEIPNPKAQIPNLKSQIPNKYKTRMRKIQNGFGHWFFCILYLFEIWDLRFEISFLTFSLQ